jgi:hypothetical protein
MGALKIRDGDYVTDGLGGLERVEGSQELLQRVLFKLTARRGSFPFIQSLGSTLYTLGSLPARQRQAGAEAAVMQALEDEKDLKVEQVKLDGDRLSVFLNHQGQKLDLELTLQ